MTVQRIFWMLLWLLLIPVLLVVGFLFFGIIAIIVICIIAFIVLLSVVIYLNRKFKYFISNVQTKTVKCEEKKVQKKHETKRTRKEKEIIIEYIEEKTK